MELSYFMQHRHIRIAWGNTWLLPGLGRLAVDADTQESSGIGKVIVEYWMYPRLWYLDDNSVLCAKVVDKVKPYLKVFSRTL